MKNSDMFINTFFKKDNKRVSIKKPEVVSVVEGDDESCSIYTTDGSGYKYKITENYDTIIYGMTPFLIQTTSQRKVVCILLRPQMWDGVVAMIVRCGFQKENSGQSTQRLADGMLKHIHMSRRKILL